MSNNGVRVRVHRGELEKALKKFKKMCQDAGIPSEIKKRQYFEKPSEVRKRKEKQRLKNIKKGKEEPQVTNNDFNL